MKPIVFLTSTLKLYEKDENGNKIPINFGNENQILDNLKKHIKKYDNFLFVASNETNTEATDKYASLTFASFDLTLPFKNYQILDIRTEEKVEELIKEADLIMLSGGYLPYQNAFFNKINLRNIICNTNGVIMGGSAGTMNCADIVYVAPELEGESIDPHFEKYKPGLGLTKINILPHYNVFKDYVLDNKKYIEEIIVPESYEREIIALEDGSYYLLENSTETLFGEAYKIKDGEIVKIIGKK